MVLRVFGRLSSANRTLRELLRRADLELVADGVVHGALGDGDAASMSCAAEAMQHLGVERESPALHAREHRDVRDVDLVEHRDVVRRLELRRERVGEPQREVGVAGGVGGAVLGRGCARR